MLISGVLHQPEQAALIKHLALALATFDFKKRYVQISLLKLFALIFYTSNRLQAASRGRKS